MSLLFAATLFVSATLVFWIQPLVAKMLLPLLGGAPAVWNTCLVFFQAGLLAGYAYAHWISRRLGQRFQAVLHLGLLSGGLWLLPIWISVESIPLSIESSYPVWWLLAVLFLAVGWPFFLISSTAPLLQKWYSRRRDASAKDPYFLYSPSNLGSLAALLGFPILLEPNLPLREQSWIWAGGYGLLILLMASCAASSWRLPEIAESASDDLKTAGLRSSGGADESEWRRRMGWLLLAAVPSSLLLGVTNFLATDIASIPLLWVIPLSLYLITFIFAFARRTLISSRWSARVLPMSALGLVFLLASRTTEPIWLLILVHLGFFFLAAMVCHGRLAQDRPPVRHLTEFYLWIALGGVLGGTFNALLAPLLFPTVIEYPIAVIAACLLRPNPTSAKRRSGDRLRDFGWPLLLGVFTAFLAVTMPLFDLQSAHLRSVLVLGLPAILCFMLVDRSFRFAAGVAAVMLGGWFYAGAQGQTQHLNRNFFGVSRVILEPSGRFRRLVHGNTLHGRQFADPKRQCEPLAYYHRRGPLGDIFHSYEERAPASRVAVIGLGTGSMASYARAGQQWTFYEIDPVVIRIARNFFSYLSQCVPVPVQIIQGDARLRIREAAPAGYGLIVLDAFSSDAIPVHLLTREAIDLYLSKLAPGGILAFHISNRYLDLRPVVGDLAKAAGLICCERDDGEEDQVNGKDRSHWVVMARQEADLGPLPKDASWKPVQGREDPQVWTDDFSDLLSILKWN